jgi:alkylmercury lyase
MTIRMTPIDTAELAEQLVAARPALDLEQQRLAISLYRLLAEGAPAEREDLAARTGSALDKVGRFLDEQPGVHLDEQGRVVAFWGLALDGTPHRMTVRGRELRAWCAWDTLFLPELLGETVAVASTCPATGAPIALVVTPEDVRQVQPAGTVLTFLRRERPFDADTITTFCRYVPFFASDDAAGEWTAQHPGTFVLSLAQGIEIAHRANRHSAASATSGSSGSPARNWRS